MCLHIKGLISIYINIIYITKQQRYDSKSKKKSLTNDTARSGDTGDDDEAKAFILPSGHCNIIGVDLPLTPRAHQGWRTSYTWRIWNVRMDEFIF